GSFGTGSCAVCATSLPYVSRRLLGACTTAPRSARHEARSTFHVDAAASISISRAAAPALRSGSHEVRIAVLPPVDIRRDHPAGYSRAHRGPPFPLSTWWRGGQGVRTMPAFRSAAF